MKLQYIKEPDLDLVADLQNGWEIRNNGAKIELVKVRGVSKFEYDTLEDFCKEWVTIKEPLLYGKLRESLKLWAEYHKVDELRYYEGVNISWFCYYSENLDRMIDFDVDMKLPKLVEGKVYKLTELVGEE